MNCTRPTPQLRIWQQNLNKSLIAQQHMLNTARPSDWDILLLQEPWFGNTVTRASHSWRVLYPNIYFRDKTSNLRSIIFVNTNISTDNYEQIQFQSTDVTGVSIKTENGTLAILNVYNDCRHNAALETVNNYLTQRFSNNNIPDNQHVIIAGDFNRHHNIWESKANAHLTTSEPMIRPLLDLIDCYDLRMALPPNIPTLQALSTGNWTRPDNVWCTNHTTDLFTNCNTNPGLRGPNTDHLPILSKLDLPLNRSVAKPSRNFRSTDWKEFNTHLKGVLSTSTPSRIRTENQFRTSLNTLTAALKSTIETKVPLNPPVPFTKRWWTPELGKLRKEKNRLANTSHKWRGLPEHPSHELHRDATRRYTKLIETTKKEHWEEWLTNAAERDIWTASKYATDPPSDGGKSRIPTLILTDGNGNPTRTTNNAEKTEALAKAFFPPPPLNPNIPLSSYPRPAKIFKYFTRAQIKKAASRLSAYKAPGPDGIPNAVLKESIEVIANHLFYIFRAIFELETYPDEWQESIMVVLRKPGKPSYEEPKAYRPIALLNTLGKLLSSLVAEDLSHYSETRGVFPNNQFGGRPQRSTSDSMLLLTHMIKEKWRQKKVASVLFLDVQGAFPNVVKEVLLHNMRLRAVPQEYIRLTERLLTGRKMRLSFDDYISDFIEITNGNNQGCPLSMIFYAFYNTGLLQISPPSADDEAQFGCVDDVALLATGNTLDETHAKLADMMTRPGGGFDWSENHYSQFELSKLALMDFTPSPRQSSPLTILHPRTNRRTTISPTSSHKFLGILLDPRLKWKPQSERATRSAEAWINLIRRLARTSRGISAKGMRQLYTAIAVPRMSYAAEVWFTLPHKHGVAAKNRTGSVKFTNRLQSAQRKAVITMLGAMRTTAGDVLNTHAFTPPPHLLFLKALTRTATRLVSLPDSHPLRKPVLRAIKRPVKRHRSPLHTLFATTNVRPNRYETVLATRRRRNYKMLGTVEIDEDKEVAIEKANCITGLAIFTDGSGHEGKIGAAAVMMQDGRVKKKLTYHLGSEKEHTVYEAEALAVVLALHMLSGLRTELSKVTIGTDNQAVLLGLQNQTSKPGHYLLDKIHDTLMDFQVAQSRNRGERVEGYKKGAGRTRLADGSKGWKEWKLEKRCEVRFVWTPGHENIEGNERADEVAKGAASGQTSSKKKLPAFLRRDKLPVSVSATRQMLKKEMKNKWHTELSASPRYKMAKKIDHSLPSDDFLHIANQLRRNQTSLLVQLRTGHVPLNAILHRIKRSDTSECPHCKNGIRETIPHYILSCPHYRGARHLLQAKLRRDASSIPFLLGTRTGIPHLLRYVSNTNWFKATFGEVRPDDDFVLEEKEKKGRNETRRDDDETSQ